MIEAISNLVNSFVYPMLAALGMYAGIIAGSKFFGPFKVEFHNNTVITHKQEPASWQPQQKDQS